ncbi:MAG: Lrp/AsnC family transcriptional regulator [Clostridia bacterium]|nr:Lrp/AsnC family transcriptional regulator [Clostridia bacterium]
MYINGIDYVDNKIVRLLKDNARMSYSDIASEIGLSRTAVTTRIANLEKAGIIKGYNTILKNELLSFVLSIETKTDVFEEWKDALKNIPEVVSVVQISGESKLIAICQAKNIDVIRDLVTELHKSIGGIKVINANSVVDVIKDSLNIF